MKLIIVLAMHGAMPNDFPDSEKAELFRLDAQIEGASGEKQAELEYRYAELNAKMRNWPRTSKNDPFYAGSMELASHLSKVTGLEVIIGFNQFCAPDLDEALDIAIARGAEKVIVVTPMMTRGGEHSGVDIPKAIKRAQARHPKIPIIYAWPFEVSEVAKFLASQIAKATKDI